MSAQPHPPAPQEDERPRYRGLDRSGWIAIWTMALLFGLVPVALRWAPLGSRYDDEQRGAIDVRFAGLLSALPAAAKAQSPELQRLAELEALSSAMQLGLSSGSHMAHPGYAASAHLSALASLPSGLLAPTDLTQAREALLAWHEGTATTSAGRQVIAARQLELLAAELATQHGDDPGVRPALLHMGRVLRESADEGFARAGWAIAAHALLPITGEALPPGLERELPAPEEFESHLLELARALDASLGRAINTPRSGLAERERFLEYSSNFSERGSAELREQRTELRELAATLTQALDEASSLDEPSRLVLRIDQLTASEQVEGSAGSLFLSAARELATAGQRVWASGHLRAPAAGGL